MEGTGWPKAKRGFFDDYPRFFETGNTGAGSSARLNARYDALIAKNLDSIRGKTVLDVGSHDGRWSFAALRAGAQHVVGIEPAAVLVESGAANFREYGIDEERSRFHVADALETLQKEEVRVDTVFLFGILYHIHYHVALISELHRTGAETVIIDSQLSPDFGEGVYANTISFTQEPIDNINTGKAEIYPGAGVAIVGAPSRHALGLIFRNFGFLLREIPWGPYIAKWGSEGLMDYATGIRASFVATRPPPEN